MRPSATTWLFAGFSVASIAVISALVNTPVLAEELRVAVSDAGSALVITASGLLALLAALSFRRGEPARRQWLPIAVAILLTGAGDCVWTYYEVVRGMEPYPGPADALYVAQYPFIAFGLVSAALAYRTLVDIRRPLAVTAVAAGLAAAAVVFGLLLPYIIADPRETVAVKVLSSFYPLADIVLAAAPALFVVLVLFRLGSGSLAWPWRACAAGTMLLAAADTAFAWQDWTGAYTAGGVVDVGWMLAFALMGLGASLARDVALSASTAARSSEPAAEAAA